MRGSRSWPTLPFVCMSRKLERLQVHGRLVMFTLCMSISTTSNCNEKRASERPQPRQLVRDPSLLFLSLYSLIEYSLVYPFFFGMS